MDLKISRILLPVEFSERCRGAARYAEALASHFHAELVVLHVMTPTIPGRSGAGEAVTYSSVAGIVADQRTRAQGELADFLGDAPADLRICRTLLEGDPAGRIVQYAHNSNVDLLVMATHGYGPFRRFLLGSVTAKALHDLNCPVWTGPHLEDAPQWTSITMRRIACAIDFGPQTRPVLEWGAALAREFASELVILHSIPAANSIAGGLSFDPDLRDRWESEVREKIAQLQEELGIDAEVRVAAGDVAIAVSNAAREEAADLLVIGRSHGSAAWGRLRANAYALVRESPCPVISI